MKTREEYLEKFKKLKIQAEVGQVSLKTDHLKTDYLTRFFRYFHHHIYQRFIYREIRIVNQFIVLALRRCAKKWTSLKLIILDSKMKMN